MYCPKCGTQNIEDAKFCRGCGADITLVSQAMSGQLLPEKRAVGYDAEGQPFDETGYRIRESRQRRLEKVRPPRLDKAISTGFTGVAFLFVAIVLAIARSGRGWWYWRKPRGIRTLQTGGKKECSACRTIRTGNAACVAATHQCAPSAKHFGAYPASEHHRRHDEAS
jgi:zinc-ribbon domain